MASINFAHPSDPDRVHLYADLYYQYYDLLKVRSVLRQEFAHMFEASATPSPRLPQDVQIGLEKIEQEARELMKGAHSIDDDDMAEDICDRRTHMFYNTHKLGAHAWRGDADNASNADSLRVRMQYCEYCLDQLREKIQFLQDNSTMRDPFNLLQAKFALNDDELEILIFLYHYQFEHPEPINGASILRWVIGCQHMMFRAQLMIFESSRLVASGLLVAVDSGCSHLERTFAVSRTSNLVLSGLHVDYPLMNFTWDVAARRAAAARKRAANWAATVSYAGGDVLHAVRLAEWCHAEGRELHVVQLDVPILSSVVGFAVVVEDEFAARRVWEKYLELRVRLRQIEPEQAESEPTVIPVAGRRIEDVLGDLSRVAPAVPPQVPRELE